MVCPAFTPLLLAEIESQMPSRSRSSSCCIQKTFKKQAEHSWTQNDYQNEPKLIRNIELSGPKDFWLMITILRCRRFWRSSRRSFGNFGPSLMAQPNVSNSAVAERFHFGHVLSVVFEGFRSCERCLFLIVFEWSGRSLETPQPV